MLSAEFWFVYAAAAVGDLAVIAVVAYVAGRRGHDVTQGDGLGYSVLAAVTPLANVIAPIIVASAVLFFGSAWLLMIAIAGLNKAGRAHQRPS
jgi:hypothetical protein